MYVNDFVTHGKTLIFQQLILSDDFVEEIWNLSLQSYSNKNFVSFFFHFVAGTLVCCKYLTVKR